MAKPSKLLHGLTWAVDLPDEPIPGQPLVEIAGNSRVLVEHHMGVTEYGENHIRVKVKFGSVCVCGSKLELARMIKGQLVITGCIECVKLDRRQA
jgi:sporulation protein YqfC